MTWLARILFKITGWLPGLIAFRPKFYSEDRKAKTKHIKGKAIVIANHKNISDFFVIYLTFFFKRVRTLVSELIYQKKLLAFFCKCVGNILVHRERSDLSFMSECEKRLNKGDVICIFPEGRFVKEKDLDTFKPAAVYLALRTNTPIIPVYISHNGPLSRKRINVGKPIDLTKYCNEKIPSSEKVKQLCEMLRSKVKELGHQIELYEKYKAWNKIDFHWFIFDSLRFFCKISQWLVFPTKVHYEEGANKKNDKTIKGRAIIVSKHNGLTDPPILTVDYWTRRTRIIIGDDAFNSVKIVKHLGVIKYNRTKGQNDPKLMIDTRNILKCNGVVGIYPEGKIVKNEIGEFMNGAAYFAISTNTPIYINIPLKEYKPFHRNHVMIGKKIIPSEIFSEEQLKQRETIVKLTEILHQKFVELYSQLKTYEKTKK